MHPLIRRLTTLAAAVVTVFASGCGSSDYSTASQASYTATPARAASNPLPTYQQEPAPQGPVSEAEKQAYLQRFSADMSRLQQSRDAQRRQEAKSAEAPLPPPTGGYTSEPVPPASAPPAARSYSSSTGSLGSSAQPGPGGDYGSGFGTATSQPAYPTQSFSAPSSAGQDDPNRTVYITRTGGKYHADGCQYLRRSQIPIKWSEAIRSFSPCSRCGGG